MSTLVDDVLCIEIKISDVEMIIRNRLIAIASGSEKPCLLFFIF